MHARCCNLEILSMREEVQSCCAECRLMLGAPTQPRCSYVWQESSQCCPVLHEERIIKTSILGDLWPRNFDSTRFSRKLKWPSVKSTPIEVPGVRKTNPSERQTN